MVQKNVCMPNDYRDFISDALSRGHYRDEGEIISAGLHLLAQREKENQLKLDVLRMESQKGLDDYRNGRVTDITTPEDRAKFWDGITQKRRDN